MSKHITSSFHLNTPWYEHYILIDNAELGDPITDQTNITCPICEYPEAVRLSRYNLFYPQHYWCSICENVWNRHICRCPDCNSFIWNKGCDKGQLACSICGEVYDQEFIEEWNSEDQNIEEE